MKNRYNPPKFGDKFRALRKPVFKVATFEHVPDGALFLACDMIFAGTKGVTVVDHVPRGAALRRCLHKSTASLSSQLYEEHVCVYRKSGPAAEFVRGYRDGVCVVDVAGARSRDHIFHMDTACVYVEEVQ